MTHEGRMTRGEEKHKLGITDIETEYFLTNSKPKDTKEIKENPFDKMNKEELKEVFIKNEIDFNPELTKKELILILIKEVK